MKRQNHLSLSLSTFGNSFRSSGLRHFAIVPLALAALFLAPATQAQNADATRTTLTSAPSQNGAGTTLTATVRGADGATVTSGIVSFMLANGQSVGSVPVGADGTAVLQNAVLPAATKSTSGSSTGTTPNAVLAQFDGSTTGAFSSSTSSALATTPQDDSTPPTFTATAAPTSLTVAAGQSITTTVTVSSVNSYAASIGLSCTNLPAVVTCSFNPVQQSLTANGSITAVLQIQTSTPAGSTFSMLNNHGGTAALALLLPGAFALFGFSGRRRKLFRGAAALQMIGCAMLLTGGSLVLTGCNPRYFYENHGPSPTPGTPTGTYTMDIAVVGSTNSAAIQQDIPITLIVQ